MIVFPHILYPVVGGLMGLALAVGWVMGANSLRSRKKTPTYLGIGIQPAKKIEISLA